MKLYLSSNGIPIITAFEELVGKPCSDIHVALIMNAKDYYNERLRKHKTDDGVEKFEGLGLEVTVIDLKEFRNKPDLLKKELSSTDVIWGYGGNTFCLRDEMRQSGFDEIIRDLLNDGKVYGGESAGAIVAGSTLKGIEGVDLPQAANNIIWDGLKLLDRVILPHADNAMYTDLVEHVRILHGSTKDYTELNDDEALVVDGSEFFTVRAT